MILLLLSHHYHYIHFLTLSDAAAVCNDNGETAAASSDSVM
jgi:hypothetical protein